MSFTSLPHALHATIVLCFISIFFVAETTAKTQLHKLEIKQAMVLENALGLEPSGLASCDDQLLMVSDKHDQLIFQLHFKDNKAIADTYSTLNNIPENPNINIPWLQKIKLWFISQFTGNYLDWEGITCDDDGNIYLLSETTVSVLKITSGGELKWLTNSLYTSGKSKGLFFKTYGEGLAWGSNNHIYIAAERQPRGLLDTSLQNGTLNTEQVIVLDATPLPAATLHQRSPDFTGLMVLHNYIYTLERNHSAFCQRNLTTFSVTHCWSYAHVENAPVFGYINSRYGLAEGLAVHQKGVFIIFDNNNQPRESAPNRYPLIFEFIIPEQLSEDS